MTYLLAVKTLKQETSFMSQLINKFDFEKLLTEIIGGVVQIIFFSLIFWLINKLGTILITRTFEKYRKNDSYSTNRTRTIYTLVKNIFHYTIILFYLYSILSSLGIPVGTLIAGAGIISVAIGLGAQGFVSDIVTGFFILLEQQFDVGDAVTINTISGTVYAVGIRTTQIKSYDGTLNFIPNRNITIVSNLSRNNMRVLINLRLYPDADIQKVESCLKQVNKNLLPQYSDIKSGPDLMGLVDLGNNQFAYQVIMYVKNGEQNRIQRTFLTAYLQSLTDKDIKFPQSTLNLAP